MKLLRILPVLVVGGNDPRSGAGFRCTHQRVDGIDPAGPHGPFFHFQRSVAPQCVAWFDAARGLLRADGGVSGGSQAFLAWRCSLACRAAGGGSGVSLEHVERSRRHLYWRHAGWLARRGHGATLARDHAPQRGRRPRIRARFLFRRGDLPLHDDPESARGKQERAGQVHVRPSGCSRTRRRHLTSHCYRAGALRSHRLL